MKWVNDYIGKEFQDRGRGDPGYDCWGLACQIMEDIFNVSLPGKDHTYNTCFDSSTTSRIILGYSDGFHRIPENKAKEGDLVLIRKGNYPCHIGLVVQPGWMIHIEKGCNSVQEDYRQQKWKKRVVGFYRHLALQ